MNKHAQKAAEALVSSDEMMEWKRIDPEAYQIAIKRTASIIKQHAIKPSVAQRDEVLKRFLELWQKMNDVRSDCINKDGSYSFMNGSFIHRELDKISTAAENLLNQKSP